ncbi:MAG: alpha/beta hydrolase [Bacteroidales bacterium]|nr:alpha/beta hydrolase [Bacteroidales bacterium]
MKYYIIYNGGKIHYSDTGSGRAVVLLHGYLESSDIWRDFAGLLSERYRVISVDLPGHGRSNVYGDIHTMEFMATGIRQLLLSLDIKNPVLVGHSMGGYVALAFAELYHNEISGYCLFHSHPFADTPETRGKREREINFVRMGKKYLMYPTNISMMYASSNLEKLKEAVERSKTIASSISDEGIIAVLKGMMARPSRLHIMEEGLIPCLWILGRHDNYINCDAIQSKVRLPANARLVILENSGHLGFIEEPQLSATALTQFIDGLPA